MRRFLILAVILTLIASMGAPAFAVPPSGGPVGLQRAIMAQEAHTDALLSRPGVVGTAVGLDENGLAVVKIYLEHGGVAGLPSRLNGVPVQVVVTGRFYAQKEDPTARQERAVPIGVSTGHPDITAGTIGARVKDVAGKVYALSNNHVLANSNKAKIGDSILQPGPYDGGKDPADKIGILADFQEIFFDGSSNAMDAAIALSSTEQLGTATLPGGYGEPGSDIVAATFGLGVQKYGRTTELTQGTVAELNVTVNVCYESRGIRCTKVAKFVGQIAISDGNFSAGGDSGSLIVTDDEAKSPVGLLFAGSSTRTIASPIGPVLERFGVTIDNSGSENLPPVAAFTYRADNLTVTFDASNSSDTDGNITNYGWNFGDDSIGSGMLVEHTYAAPGTYSVTLTVTDNEDATDSVSHNVVVSIESQGEGSMYLGAPLADTKNIKGKSGNWEVQITVTIVDANGQAVAGGTVYALWSGAKTGSVSGVTGSYGTVTFTTGNMSGGSSITFTVDRVTHTTLVYNSDDQAHLDFVTVTK